MPNWCHNTLTITGSNKNLKEFTDKLATSAQENTQVVKGLFEIFHPMPEGTYGRSLEAGDAEKYPLNWYDWSCENWGTKWDTNAKIAENNGELIKFYYDTAWAPGEKWVSKVAKDFPKLTFNLDYYSLEGDYRGVTEFKDWQYKSDYKNSIRDEMTIVDSKDLDKLVS